VGGVEINIFTLTRGWNFIRAWITMQVVWDLKLNLETTGLVSGRLGLG
jgi:hypothetical protein